jgi:DNA-binding Lrp family transcriptional regulator
MKIKIRKRYLFLVLAFSSAIIAAIVAGIDTIAVEEIKDPWAVSLSCFILALVVSGLCGFILSIPIKDKSLGGKTIDPTFKRLRIIKKTELKYHLLAGFGNAIMTIGYFAMFPLMNNNAALVLPFSQVAILYLIITESITEKDTPTLVEVQSAVIVTFGAILGSFSIAGAAANLDNIFQALLIVFLVINPGTVLFSIYQRKLKMMKINERPNDAINIRVWNVVFALIFTIIIVLLYDAIYGGNHFIDGISASIEKFWLMALIAFGTFFAFVFYIRALGIGKASVTQAVKASSIIFSIPVTMLIAGVASFISDPTMLVIRVMGIVLMMLGITSFALTLTKAYIFVKMNPGYPIEGTMKRLWNIKGVNRVTAVAGQYDFIVKIHTRTLIKGYERILRKVQEIPGINQYRWQSVLREWEDL